MIKLSIADGSRIHINPAAIAYIQSLPDVAAGGDKKQAKTKVVLMTGESLSVRQASGQILIAAGFAPPKPGRAKVSESDASGE